MAAGAAMALITAACSSTATNNTSAPSTTAATPATTAPTATTTVAAATTTAKATTTTSTEAPTGPAGTTRLHFEYGPITIHPGQNNIQFSKGEVPNPTEDGWILRMVPNLRYADGTVPPVDVLHLHHGVWLNASRKDSTFPAYPERFMAVGEEKTVTQFPDGFGYPYKASDQWIINYMLHDLTPDGGQVWITYDLDFLPATAPAAATMRAVRPIWMDVQNGNGYPVFDVLKGTGTDGTFTYPDQAADPYQGRPPANVWTVDRDGVLIVTGGHLHPGGLHDDMYLDRNGASAHLFQAEAHYFEPAGAVSWDVATTVTNPDWRVTLHAGDQLRATSTYDTSKASWYESMGIMVAWMADPAAGDQTVDPFATAVDRPGVLTHGHLPENDNHGGTGTELADPTARPVATSPEDGDIDIAGFAYGAGDMSAVDPIPTVKAGGTLTFRNDDAPLGPGIWHSITACEAPCNKATGIAYPLADGDVSFDSGQLGTGGPPTAGRVDWQTPADLKPGLYTYFCRIHPFMRGAFDVTG
jgi:plastocyanin